MAQGVPYLWQVAQTETEPFADHRSAALALLNSGRRLTRKAGQFLGQLAVDPAPMTEPQFHWLSKLLVRNALPPFVGEIAP